MAPETSSQQQQNNQENNHDSPPPRDESNNGTNHHNSATQSHVNTTESQQNRTKKKNPGTHHKDQNSQQNAKNDSDQNDSSGDASNHHQSAANSLKSSTTKNHNAAHSSHDSKHSNSGHKNKNKNHSSSSPEKEIDADEKELKHDMSLKINVEKDLSDKNMEEVDVNSLQDRDDEMAQIELTDKDENDSVRDEETKEKTPAEGAPNTKEANAHHSATVTKKISPPDIQIADPATQTPSSSSRSDKKPASSPQIMLTPAEPSPAAWQQTPKASDLSVATKPSLSTSSSSSDTTSKKTNNSRSSSLPSRSSTLLTQSNNNNNNHFLSKKGPSNRTRSLNHGSSHRLNEQISPLTPATEFAPPLSPIVPPLENIPSPSHHSSHESTRHGHPQNTYQQWKPSTEPKHRGRHVWSSFTDVPLLKTICIPFSSAVPPVHELASFMDPLYFTNEPSLHVLGCIHNSPQFVVGFSSQERESVDLKKFDQIVKVVKSRFPFVIPCFVVICSPGTDFNQQSYIAHVASNSLAMHCLQVTETLIMKFKTLSNKVITAPEKYMQQPITTHEQNTFDSTAQQTRADYIMLTGHFEYARDEFEEAIRLCKTNNDWISLAASYEGIAACLWHEWRKYNRDQSAPSEKLIQDIIRSYTQYLSIIEKRNELKLFHTESMLRLAQFFADIKHWYRSYVVEAIQLLNDAVVEASIQSVQTRITVHGIAALICQQMGCKRKYGFFLKQVAQQHHELAHKQHLAVQYASKAFECYDIPLKSSVYNKSIPQGHLPKPAFEATATGVSRGWNSVQRELVKEVIKFASAQLPPDVLTEVQLSFFLLSCFHSVMSPSEQRHVFTRICRLSPNLPANQPFTVVPLPFVKEVCPNSLPKHAQPEEDAQAKAKTKKSVFEYTTIDLSDDDTIKVEKIHWVQGEAATVTISLVNPLMVQLQFKTVTIETDCFCTVYPGAATLAPQSGTTLKIRVIPHEACEEFTIKNVLLTIAHDAKFPHPIPVSANVPENISVTVIPALPSLSVEQPDKVIEIYEGEKNTAVLTLTNMGRVPIDKMSFSILPPRNAPKGLVTLDIDVEKIPPGEFKKVELFVDGTSFLIDPAYHKNHIGKSQEYSLFLEYKCNEKSPLWLRRKTYKFSIFVKACVTLDACVAINQHDKRQLIGRVSNFAPEPIILLSDTMSRKLIHEERSGDTEKKNVNIPSKQEFHHLLHYHSKGVTIGPSQTQLVLLKHHIGQSMVDRVPYSVKSAHAYHKYFAQKLRWQTTTTNTTGIVALRDTEDDLMDNTLNIPDVDPVVQDELGESLSEDDAELCESLPDDFLSLSIKLDGEDIPSQNLEKRDFVMQVPLGAMISCEARIRSSLLNDDSGRLNQFLVFHEGIQGLHVADSHQYMHSGSQAIQLQKLHETKDDGSTAATRDSIHALDLWFTEEGNYQIRVECSTLNGENPIVQPKRVCVQCVAG